MKKVFSIIALGAMTLSLSSFTNVNNLSNNSELAYPSICGAQAEAYGEFMAGHEGMSGSHYALEYYSTFCE